MTDQVNLNIHEGDPFFAHEVTINFTPTQLTLDFKCITPRSDPRSKKPNFQLKHNVVMMDPWHAKSLIDILNNVVQKYEGEFGKVSKPKSLVKAEKKQKELALAQGKKESELPKPNYMG